eukprot:2628671-Lingulodinium_polyedra.AAC.1
MPHQSRCFRGNNNEATKIKSKVLSGTPLNQVSTSGRFLGQFQGANARPGKTHFREGVFHGGKHHKKKLSTHPAARCPH